MPSGFDTNSSPPNPFFRSSPHFLNGNVIHDLSPNPSSPALSTTSSGSGASKKAEPPKRLRYWLIDMIDSGEIPGLQWEDGTHSIFRIPWKHAGKNNWKEEDCRIFQAWAEHRGKYRKGDKVDPATWKTRLRCALNKLGDIKELKNRSNLEGNDPYRVYQLMPEQDKNSPDYLVNHQQNIQMLSLTRLSPRMHDVEHREFGREKKPPMHPSHYGTSGMMFREQNANRQEFQTPSNKLPASPQSNYLNGSPEPTHHARRPVEAGYPQTYGMNGSANPQGFVQDPRNYAMDMDGLDINGQRNGMRLATPAAEYTPPIDPPQPHEMDIFIRYRGQVVSYTHVTVPMGCRIHYGDSDLQLIAAQTHKLPSGIFGSEALYQIGFPECEPFSVSPKQVSLTKHVLNNIKRGLILSYENGCFYARRLCQSRVFVFGSETKALTPEKLNRDKKLKVFDYTSFHSHLQRYVKEGRSKLPEVELKASFGQNWSIKTPIDKNLVTLTMKPRAATYYLQKIREQHRPKMFGSLNSFNESIIDSGPDTYDQLAEHITRTSEENINKLLDDVLLNIDPNTIQAFTETPLNVPMTSGAPIPGSQQGQFATGGGYFEPNFIPIAPPDVNDVEMG